MSYPRLLITLVAAVVPTLLAAQTDFKPRTVLLWWISGNGLRSQSRMGLAMQDQR